MPRSDARPILVIGAGPTGLAAALELARLGRPVRIVDQKATRSQHSKAIGVNARTLELLEASGATERLLATGLRIRAPQLPQRRAPPRHDPARAGGAPLQLHSGAPPGGDRADPRAAPRRARHPGRVVDRAHGPGSGAGSGARAAGRRRRGAGGRGRLPDRRRRRAQHRPARARPALPGRDRPGRVVAGRCPHGLAARCGTRRMSSPGPPPSWP